MGKPAAGPIRPKLWRYLIAGTLIGGILGLLEALVSSTGNPNYWRTFQLHYGQLGAFGWYLGTVGGFIVFKRVEHIRIRRWGERHYRGQCTECGYDLRGNKSGRCPECGASVPPEHNPR